MGSYPSHLVEKGNTQKDVNKKILEFLIDQANPPSSLFDAPCGEGEFLIAFRRFFPQARLAGQDLFAKPLTEIKEVFSRGDLKSAFVDQKNYDVITCISGVMVFDHVSSYIEKAATRLNPQGYLILTNDNILTVRDRLSFLFFGQLKRFKLIYSPQEGNWNVVLIQALWKLVKANKLKLVKVEYTSFYPEDFLFLPLALLLYPIWWCKIYFSRGEMDSTTRRQLFPFAALLARHYIIYAQKDSLRF